MGTKGRWLLILIVIVATTVLVVQNKKVNDAKREKEKAELQAGLDASRILSATFQEVAMLNVATLTGKVMSRGACVSAYVFSNEQRTVAPYAVDYKVNLARVDRSSFRWDARDRIMFVDLPGVTLGAPNIDMSRARSKQTGTFVSRTCGLTMQRTVAGQLKAKAGEHARRPDYLTKARESARAAVSKMIRAPLAAAGLDAVKVRVRFDSDPRPADDQQWDRSRSIQEVLADTRFQP